jgi:hypothetical protein
MWYRSLLRYHILASTRFSPLLHHNSARHLITLDSSTVSPSPFLNSIVLINNHLIGPYFSFAFPPFSPNWALPIQSPYLRVTSGIKIYNRNRLLHSAIKHTYFQPAIASQAFIFFSRTLSSNSCTCKCNLSSDTVKWCSCPVAINTSRPGQWSSSGVQSVLPRI